MSNETLIYSRGGEDVHRALTHRVRLFFPLADFFFVPAFRPKF